MQYLNSMQPLYMSLLLNIVYLLIDTSHYHQATWRIIIELLITPRTSRCLMYMPVVRLPESLHSIIIQLAWWYNGEGLLQLVWLMGTQTYICVTLFTHHNPYQLSGRASFQRSMGPHLPAQSHGRLHIYLQEHKTYDNQVCNSTLQISRVCVHHNATLQIFKVCVCTTETVL